MRSCATNHTNRFARFVGPPATLGLALRAGLKAIRKIPTTYPHPALDNYLFLC